MLNDKRRKILLVLVLSFSVLAISFTFYFYQVFFSPNTMVDSDREYVLRIPSNATYSLVNKELYDENVINDAVSFGFVAKVLGYQEAVKPGLYIIKPKMTNLELVRLLRSGDQAPIRITFNNVRTKKDLAEKITPNLEMTEEHVWCRGMYTYVMYIYTQALHRTHVRACLICKSGVFTHTRAPGPLCVCALCVRVSAAGCRRSPRL